MLLDQGGVAVPAEGQVGGVRGQGRGQGLVLATWKVSASTSHAEHPPRSTSVEA